VLVFPKPAFRLHARPISHFAVLAGTKALDAAYGEAKKAKQQLR
jgi:hypothetical protein